MYNDIKADPKYDEGVIASYIPTLAKANPKVFSAAFCSIDGQFTEVGDKQMFSLQSIAKVIAYAFLHSIYEEQGKRHEVHRWVGEEPSG